MNFPASQTMRTASPVRRSPSRPLKKCGSAACLRAPHRQALGGGTATGGPPRQAPHPVRAHGRAPLRSAGTSDFRPLCTSSTGCQVPPVLPSIQQYPQR